MNPRFLKLSYHIRLLVGKFPHQPCQGRFNRCLPGGFRSQPFRQNADRILCQVNTVIHTLGSANARPPHGEPGYSAPPSVLGKSDILYLAPPDSSRLQVFRDASPYFRHPHVFILPSAQFGLRSFHGQRSKVKGLRSEETGQRSKVKGQRSKV